MIVVFIIDKVHIPCGGKIEDRLFSPTTIMPIGTHLDAKMWIKAKPTKFRLYDDNGELYYSGRYRADKEAMAAGREKDLLNWGAGYAGCTLLVIQKDGEWSERYE